MTCQPLVHKLDLFALILEVQPSIQLNEKVKAQEICNIYITRENNKARTLIIAT